MRKLQGKVGVVTGGGMGIGEAVAGRFAAEGATVAVIDISRTAAEATARAIAEASGQALAIECDVTSVSQVELAVGQVVNQCGHIDALVNCAGIHDPATFLEIKPENWDRVLAVNLKGTFLVGQAVARTMVEHGGGAIVNMASIDGYAAEFDAASYAASKSGVHGLTRSAAIELARYGIRVNSISPGYVDTPMVAATWGPDIMRSVRTTFDRAPIRRLLRPGEIAAVCVFLVSDEASAVTGTDLIADGGLLANAYVWETVGTRAAE